MVPSRGEDVKMGPNQNDSLHYCLKNLEIRVVCLFFQVEGFNHMDTWRSCICKKNKKLNIPLKNSACLFGGAVCENTHFRLWRSDLLEFFAVSLLCGLTGWLVS